MRTESEILDLMKQIENDRKQLLKYYIASNNDTERGIISEQNMSHLLLLQQLKWVLKL